MPRSRPWVDYVGDAIDNASSNGHQSFVDGVRDFLNGFNPNSDNFHFKEFGDTVNSMINNTADALNIDIPSLDAYDRPTYSDKPKIEISDALNSLIKPNIEISDALNSLISYLTGDVQYNRTTALQEMAQDFNADEAKKARYFNAAEAQKARDFSAEEARIARVFNHNEAELNRAFQRDLSNTAYQRASADMRAAGLNPYLVYSQGGAPVTSGSSAVASVPSAPAASTSSASIGASSAGKDSVGALANTALSSIVSSAFRLGSFFK